MPRERRPPGGRHPPLQVIESSKFAGALAVCAIDPLESIGLKTLGGFMSVEQKVKQIIVEQLGVDEAQVDMTASFVDDLGADSLDIVELVMAFEEAFDLDIPDEDAEKIATVQNAVEYIDAKKKT